MYVCFCKQTDKKNLNKHYSLVATNFIRNTSYSRISHFTRIARIIIHFKYSATRTLHLK